MLLPQSVIRITLDVREVEKQLSFAIKQNDSVRRLIVTLTDKGKPYLIGIGCYAVFSATTSKNTVISNGCQIKNNEIIYDLSETDTAVVGRMDAEITLFGSNGEEITSPSFTINVYKSKISDYAGEVVASDDFSTLKNLIGETNSRIAKIDEILESDGKTIDEAIEAGIETIDEHTEQQASAIDQKGEDALNSIQSKGEEVLATIPADYKEISNATARHTAEIADAKSKISLNSKRLANLEAGIPDEDFVEDSEIAYVKDVPTNALPYAKINKLGAMTRKCTNVFPEDIAYGYWEINGSTGNVYFISMSGILGSREKFAVKPNTTYCVSSKSSWAVWFVDENYKSLGRMPADGWGYPYTTFTTPSTPCYAVFSSWYDGDYQYDIMINEGTEPLPYEPYFAGLRSAEVTEVESVGVNVLPYPYDDTTHTVNGVTFIDNGDGTITVNGTATENATYFMKNSTLSLSAGKYTISGLPFDGGWTTIITQLASSDGFAFNNILAQGETFTLNSGVKDMIVVLVVFKGYTANNLVFKPMLNKGSTALPYSPYTKNTLSIPEAIRPKNGINNDVYDYIEWREDGTRKNIQRTKKITVKAENITGFATENYYGHRVAMTNISTDGAIVNNLSKYGITSIPSYGVSEGSYYWVKDKCIGIGNNELTICDSTLTTLDDFKALCPFDVVYAINPIITDISDILSADNLIAVEGGGTITFKNEFGYDVPSEVEYYINAVSGVIVDGSHALKVGDTIITEAQLKALLALV